MESEMFKKGIAKRRKVLGDEYVSKALASADELGADMQKLVTEYAWGEVWNKENLSDRDRSLVNLGIKQIADEKEGKPVFKDRNRIT